MSAKVITIAQQKGGSGKTTMTAHLAVAFTEMGKSVGLIDTDPQGSLGRWYLNRIEAGLEAPELGYTTATAWGSSMEIKLHSGNRDILLIDTPPKIDADLRPSLRESDLALIPVSASYLDLWATEAVLGLAEREDCAAYLLLNRAMPRAKVTAEVRQAMEELPAPILETMICNRVAYSGALGSGRGVSEVGRSAPAAKEIAALAEEIAKKL